MTYLRSSRSAAPSAVGGRRSSTTIALARRTGRRRAVNFCAKQVKRAGRGFTRFKNYRLRVLLYAAAGGVAWPVTIQAPRLSRTRPH